MRYARKITAILLVLILMFSTTMFCENDNRVLANASGIITDDYVNFRNSPGTGNNVIKDNNGKDIQLCYGHPVTILDSTTNTSWTKISTTYGGASYTGYVASQYVKITQSGAPEIEESIPSDDAEFEAELTKQGFPESYKNALRALHEKYPSWEFKAIHTNIEWSTLLANECNKHGSVVKNTVQGTSGSPKYNWRSTKVGYDFAKDEWSSYDGSTWYAASDELVIYYLDPRTYLDEMSIFAFESLSYQEGVHNVQGVEAILKGTFMYNAKVCDVTVDSEDTRTYAEVIMEAAKSSGVSPYHIASRIRLEMGATANDCAKGTSESYPGIYNYFNIGAYDSADGTAPLKGLKYAAETPEDGKNYYNRPWDTVEKAITGGSLFLGRSYINVGQDTLYTQKFNVTNKDNLFSHQYMTNVQAPITECKTVYKAYANNNMLDSSMIFEIPVYLNMPEVKSVQPDHYGNPNNWLKTLNIDGYTLTPTFGVNTVNNYSLIVREDVQSIKISATTVNSNARIAGTGTVDLKKGTNYINIVVTAQNGDIRTYTLMVVRGSASSSEPEEPEVPEEPDTSTYKRGDLNDDGKISTIDVVLLRRVILGIDSSTEDILKRGDINGDKKISTIDVVMIRRHLLEIELISN